MLEGLKVMEVGQEPAVRFCGWVFAMHGASVTRFRSPRREGPVGDRWSDAFLNAGKSIVTRTPNLTAERESDVAQSDVVIGDPDIDWSRIGELCGATGTVEPFGADGPYADWCGNEIVYATLGGASGYTFTRDGTPVYGYGDRYQYLAGLYLYQSVCACLLRARRHPEEGRYGSAPRVRVSNLESVVSLLPYPTTQYEYNGAESTLEQSGPRFVSECQDGFIVVYAGFAWEPIARTLDRLDLIDDARFVANAARFENAPALGEIVDEWAALRTVQEACRAGERCNVAVTEVRSPADVLTDRTLRDRGAWTEVDAEGRRGRIPVLPYTVDGIRPHLLEVTDR